MCWDLASHTYLLDVISLTEHQLELHPAAAGDEVEKIDGCEMMWLEKRQKRRRRYSTYQRYHNCIYKN